MNAVSRFFLNCSGVNKDLLDEIPQNYQKSELTKFIGIGGAIFFTSLLAFLSFSFAASTFIPSFVEEVDPTSSNKPFDFVKFIFCILIGAVWGFMIFNLDRYIVTSMRKKSSKSKEIYYALPRILIALLFALIISKPLELQIFSKEIESQLPQTSLPQTKLFQIQIDSLVQVNNSLRKQNDTLRKNPYTSDIIANASEKKEKAENEYANSSAKMDAEKNQYNNQRKAENRKWSSADQKIRVLSYQKDSLEGWIEQNVDLAKNRSWVSRLNGQINSEKAKRRAASREITRIKIEESKLDQTLDSLEQVKNENITELDKKRREQEELAIVIIEKNDMMIEENIVKIKQSEKSIKEVSSKYNGLLARLQSLHELKNKEGHSTIYWASNLIFLLFVAIEMAPILVKLMSPQTVYDQILSEYEKPISHQEIYEEYAKGFREINAKKLKEEKAVLSKFYERRNKIKSKFLQKGLNLVEKFEQERFEENPIEYANSVFYNPENHFSSFGDNNESNYQFNNSWGEDSSMFESESFFKTWTFYVASGILLVGVLGYSLFAFLR